MNENKEMAVFNGNGIIADMQSASADIFTSFEVTTDDDRKQVFNAMSGQGEALKSNLNKTISMRDVVILSSSRKDDDGNEVDIPVISIITTDGKVFASTSWGVYNSMRKLASVYGTLHFEKGLKVCPVEVKTKNGYTMNLKVV